VGANKKAKAYLASKGPTTAGKKTKVVYRRK